MQPYSLLSWTDIKRQLNKLPKMVYMFSRSKLWLYCVYNKYLKSNISFYFVCICFERFYVKNIKSCLKLEVSYQRNLFDGGACLHKDCLLWPCWQHMDNIFGQTHFQSIFSHQRADSYYVSVCCQENVSNTFKTCLISQSGRQTDRH